MPFKLLFPLRLLNPSLPVARIPTTTAMKCGLSVPSSRAVPIFPSIFPFKLKYLWFNGQVGVRKLSTRPFRPRPGPSSEFTRSRRGVGGGGGGGGDFRSASKSLIEDEAELSDWVSDLKESDFDSDRQTRDRSRYGDGERGRDKFGRESFTATRKRERESDVNEFRESHRTARNSRASKRFHGYSDDDDDDKIDSRRRKNLRENNRRGKFDDGKFDSQRRQKLRENNERESLNSFKGKKGLVPNKRVRFANDEDGFGNFEGEEERKGLRSGIGDLLGEEDSESGDIDDDDDEDDSVLRKKASSSLGLHKEVTVRRSLGSSDSYLSETRSLQKHTFFDF